MIEESLNHFIKIWNNTFLQDELEMFRFLSMRELLQSKKKQRRLTFTSPPFGGRDEFNNQCMRMTWHVFWNYKGLCSGTKKVWQTKKSL